MKNRILVVHPGSLGDQVVLSWALSRVMARPGRELHLASRGELGPCLVQQGCISGWTDLDGPLGASLLEGDLARVPGGEGLSRAIVLRSDAEGAVRRRIGALGVEAVVESARPPPQSDEPVRHRLGRLLGLDACEPAEAWLASGGVRNPQGVILLHPGSGGLEKCWPVAAFIELASGLERAGRRVHWLLGPAELERGLRLPEGANVTRAASIAELLGLLSEVAGYVGCDSGVSHLAVASGAPAVVLFGPSSAALWAWPVAWARTRVGDATRGADWGIEPREVQEVLLDVLSGASRYCGAASPGSP